MTAEMWDSELTETGIGLTWTDPFLDCIQIILYPYVQCLPCNSLCSIELPNKWEEISTFNSFSQIVPFTDSHTMQTYLEMHSFTIMPFLYVPSRGKCYSRGHWNFQNICGFLKIFLLDPSAEISIYWWHSPFIPLGTIGVFSRIWKYY